MELLTVNHITKEYKDFSLQDISFSLPTGYIMGYVGQNGAGKTTTINVITHLAKYTMGDVTINGIRYQDDPVKYKEMIGFIGDDTYFPLEFNATQIAKILVDFYPTFQPEKFRTMVQKWKLPMDKKIKDFSRGMKVRLMFAAVLSRDTRLLILDEATNGLDPVVKDEVLTLLQEYIADGTKSVLFSTHIISDLEEIADFIYFIDNGSKVLYDSKEELLERFLVVKGGLNDLNQSLSERMIGLKKTSIGFEGLIESNQAVYFPKACIMEKPGIQQIIVHYVKEKGGHVYGES